METPMTRNAIALAILAALAASPAAATSGFGCYRVNVSAADALNIRAEPSGSAPIVATAHAADQPMIIALAGGPRGEGVQPSLFEIHQAEYAVCTPRNLPLGARWCPVSLFDGSGAKQGWLKRRFVDHSECP